MRMGSDEGQIRIFRQGPLMARMEFTAASQDGQISPLAIVDSHDKLDDRLEERRPSWVDSDNLEGSAPRRLRLPPPVDVNFDNPE